MEYHHLGRVASAYEGLSVGAFAVHKIRSKLIEEGLAKDEEVVGTLLVCKKCSMKLIPGQNCSFTVCRAKRKPYKNRLVYHCTNCESNTYIKGIPKKVIEKKEPQKIHKRYSEEEISRIVQNRPKNFRTLNKKPKKKEIAEAFFSTKTDLYSLFQ